MKSLIYAVVLNYNGADVLAESVSALLESRDVNLKVLVVDNASSDGSADDIGKRFPAVEVSKLDVNSGFCKGNNFGMKLAMERGADFVWLVNNDAAPAPDAAKALLDAALADPQAGALGGKIYVHGTDRVLSSAGGTIDRAYFLAMSRGRGETDDGRFDTPDEVDYISGCSLFMRSDALRKVGLLDERYQFYWEDLELCLRMKESGYRVLYVPGAVTVHRESHSFGAVKSPRAAYYSMRNRLLTARKHKAGSPAMIAKTTLLILMGTYTVHKDAGHPAPGGIAVASVAGVMAQLLGRYGEAPAWLQSKWLARRRRG